MADKRLIVALDYSNLNQVKDLVEELGDSVNFYKVGMELFYSVGKEVLDYLSENGKDVFLDLKLHDIPNTTAQGLVALTKLGAKILNVHASGSFSMMQTAAQAVKLAAENLGIEKPKLIAVTVLTSIDEVNWAALNSKNEIKEQVVALAKLAHEAGMDGVVASPQEAKMIKAVCGEDFLIVTPGVRPYNAEVNDQSRIATPKMALLAGATHLVVGRPITKANNPKEAAEAILAEMEEV